jgi:putative DNA primase/helicase
MYAQNSVSQPTVQHPEARDPTEQRMPTPEGDEPSSATTPTAANSAQSPGASKPDEQPKLTAKAKPARSSKGIELVEVEPWPEPVDGAKLLDYLVGVFRRHLALCEGTAEAIALWVLFAHTHDAHQTSPRLAFLSPVPECGKTTALSILRALVPRALPTSNITPAVVFRVIEQRKPTLLIDEADTFMQGDDMRGILNSGHTRATAQVWRCEGESHKPKGFSTWAPVAIAKIGTLPETLESRSLVIPMQRRRPDEQTQPISAEDRQAFATLVSKAARWSADNSAALAEATPELPAGLFNRSRDNWRPLVAVADAAGGHWPERARRVAVLLSGSAEDPSLGVQLLSDIREILRAERLSSEELCEALREREDRPWADDGCAISQRHLARLLKPFGIAPKSVRLGPHHTPKGYMAAQFEDAFARYLPPIPPPAATAPQA